MLIGDDEGRGWALGAKAVNKPAVRPVCSRADACIGIVLFQNHQFLLDHLLISSYVIKRQTHLVWRQEILDSASASGRATKPLQSGPGGRVGGWRSLNADNPT